MTKDTLAVRARKAIAESDYNPTRRHTVERLQYFYELGKQSLSLAKISEAHWDALSILEEANISPDENALYAVWASEIPGKLLSLEKDGDKFILNGSKMFCSGAGMVDRALITTGHGIMLDLDVRNSDIEIITDLWQTAAFRETNTSTIVFKNFPVDKKNIIGRDDWYVKRKGFWSGALGPAACWGGGAAALFEYARNNKRNDPHTIAHLGAMSANVWGIETILKCAAEEIDSGDLDATKLCELAYRVRHLIETYCTDTLRRFTRAYGPYPIACIESIIDCYQELDLFLRQHHAERDLEALGNLNYHHN